MTVLKKIKFDLPIDNIRIKNLEELREHFSVEILKVYHDGILEKWLQSRSYSDEFNAIQNLKKTHVSDRLLLERLHNIFSTRTIISGKYVIHENRTVTDTKTKLIWKQDSEVGQYTWSDAMEKFSHNVRFAGNNDWRMPMIEELKTLIDKNHCPTIYLTAFPDTPSAAFWSASPHAYGALYVYFGNGDDIWGNKNKEYRIRLVRNGQ
ncbi:DUF1566 domain-containing protein [Thiothrix winogradskyi]|uniref:DUF1566 domain-containing protein n=1 Tax=Thiothrix winogradskyi TaxID=96472 RepID=A0ABY3SYU1_9GAMM|nr:DUF1566 domain-containing protein [Thiothrix winogradskyi]UJS23993.1 DUF1566 domain-containing protein [Thiothrix winogradskyi]